MRIELPMNVLFTLVENGGNTYSEYISALIGFVGVLVGSAISYFFQRKMDWRDTQKNIINEIDTLYDYLSKLIQHPCENNIYVLQARVTHLRVELNYFARRHPTKRNALNYLSSQIWKGYELLSLKPDWEEALIKRTPLEIKYEINNHYRKYFSDISKYIIQK